MTDQALNLTPDLAPVRETYFWVIHLLPTAPKAYGAPEHPSRNLMRRFSVMGGLQALLTRCALSPREVLWRTDSAGDPELVHQPTGLPYALLWDGPPLPVLRAALDQLRRQNWLPATYVAPQLEKAG